MEAKKRLYLGLLTFSLFLIAAAIWLAWYLIFNRSMMLNQVLLALLVSAAMLFLIVFALGIVAMVIMIIRSRTTPWQENVARLVNEWLFPVALLAGKLLRVDRD